MYQLLYKYFLINKRLSLPGLGNFTLQETPAALDFVKGVLKAPQSKVGFDNAVANRFDNYLLFYLTKELKMEEGQVVKQLQSFSSSIMRDLEVNNGVELPGIGQLRKNNSEDTESFVFIPDDGLAMNTLSADIKLMNSNDTKANLVELYTSGDTLILTEETEDDKLEMIVKEKQEDFWWVYALVVMMMGVGALLWYYI